MDSMGEGEGGKIWENGIDLHFKVICWTLTKGSVLYVNFCLILIIQYVSLHLIPIINYLLFLAV